MPECPGTFIVEQSMVYDPRCDFYELLGVTSSATADEIKRARRTFVREHHPDRPSASPGDGDRLKQVNLACDVLLDVRRRAVYDMSRARARVPAFLQIGRLDPAAFGKFASRLRGAFRRAGAVGVGAEVAKVFDELFPYR